MALDGATLTIEDVVAVARHHRPVVVTEVTLAEVRRARDVVDVVLARGDAAYGLNTGLGAFSRRVVSEEELDRFAIATVADQTTAYGRRLPQVRARPAPRPAARGRHDLGTRHARLLDLVAHGELARAVAAEAGSPDFFTPPTG